MPKMDYSGLVSIDEINAFLNRERDLVEAYGPKPKLAGGFRDVIVYFTTGQGKEKSLLTIPSEQTRSIIEMERERLKAMEVLRSTLESFRGNRMVSPEFIRELVGELTRLEALAVEFIEQ